MWKFFLPLVLIFSQSQPQTIWLYGDSISRGYGLAQFEHPSPINSIWGIGNLLAAENGHPEILMRYRGEQDPQRLWLDKYEAIIGNNDVVIFENAGPHFGTEAYRAWLDLWKSSAEDTRLIFTTTPDNLPVGDVSDYSIINPIIREQANYLDWEAEFTAKSQIVPLLLPDKIHFNAFGNYVATISILRSQGIMVEKFATVESEFMAQQANYAILFGFDLTKAQLHQILQELTN